MTAPRDKEKIAAFLVAVLARFPQAEVVAFLQAPAPSERRDG